MTGTILSRMRGVPEPKAKETNTARTQKISGQSRHSFQCRLGEDMSKPKYMIDVKYIDKMRALLPFMDVIPSAYNRLIGKFNFESTNPQVETFLNDLYKSIQVNDFSLSWPTFQQQLVDSCIAKGFGVGEGVRLGKNVAWDYLKNINANCIGLHNTEERYHLGMVDNFNRVETFKDMDLIYYLATDLRDGYPLGYSIYHGMPWMLSILEHLYQSISNMSWRTADPSFIISVTGGKPEGSGGDINKMMKATNTAASAMRDQIKEIMETKLYGGTRDAFAGLPYGAELKIETLGAGGEEMVKALQFPIEEMIKPCIGKSALPDWLFGYNYGRTEALSNNQIIILTENVKAYRDGLDPIVGRFFGDALVMAGYIGTDWSFKWEPIGLHDKLDEAQTELRKAQAEKIRWETALSKFDMGVFSFEQLEIELGVKFTAAEIQKIQTGLIMKNAGLK